MAIVDIPESECSIALCHSMGVPVVGFSAASPVGADWEALSESDLVTNDICFILLK